MKPRTIIDLLNLSANLYIIAKDKEMLDKISSLADKGKEKFNDLKEEFFEGAEEKQFFDTLLQRMQTAKQDLEAKIEEVAVQVYKKMHIASTNEIQQLQEKMEQLQKQMNLAESRIVALETPGTF